MSPASPHAQRFNVVLVRPIYDRNIGMCARSLANMGGARLILIAPLGNYQSHEGKQGAAGAQEMLAATTVYSSFEDFYASEGEGVRFAFSARESRLREADRLTDRLEQLRARIGTPEGNPALFNLDKPVYLFFGPEDDGLSGDDMRLAHHVCALPTYGTFTSLNLSHAVLLTLYIFNDFFAAVLPQAVTTGSAVAVAPAYYPDTTINTWLETLGFDLSSYRINIARTLHKLVLAGEPSPDDLRQLESVLQQTIRKLKTTK